MNDNSKCSQPSILELPSELIHLILTICSVQDAFKFAITCKFAYNNCTTWAQIALGTDYHKILHKYDSEHLLPLPEVGRLRSISRKIQVGLQQSIPDLVWACHTLPQWFIMYPKCLALVLAVGNESLLKSLLHSNLFSTSEIEQALKILWTEIMPATTRPNQAALRERMILITEAGVAFDWMDSFSSMVLLDAIPLESILTLKLDHTVLLTVALQAAFNPSPDKKAKWKGCYVRLETHFQSEDYSLFLASQKGYMARYYSCLVLHEIINSASASLFSSADGYKEGGAFSMCLESLSDLLGIQNLNDVIFEYLTARHISDLVSLIGFAVCTGNIALFHDLAVGQEVQYPYDQLNQLLEASEGILPLFRNWPFLRENSAASKLHCVGVALDKTLGVLIREHCVIQNWSAAERSDILEKLIEVGCWSTAEYLYSLKTVILNDERLGPYFMSHLFRADEVNLLKLLRFYAKYVPKEVLQEFITDTLLLEIIRNYPQFVRLAVSCKRIQAEPLKQELHMVQPMIEFALQGNERSLNYRNFEFIYYLLAEYHPSLSSYTNTKELFDKFYNALNNGTRTYESARVPRPRLESKITHVLKSIQLLFKIKEGHLDAQSAINITTISQQILQLDNQHISMAYIELLQCAHSNGLLSDTVFFSEDTDRHLDKALEGEDVSKPETVHVLIAYVVKRRGNVSYEMWTRCMQLCCAAEHMEGMITLLTEQRDRLLNEQSAAFIKERFGENALNRLSEQFPDAFKGQNSCSTVSMQIKGSFP
jgi:hypothetical protein